MTIRFEMVPKFDHEDSRSKLGQLKSAFYMLGILCANCPGRISDTSRNRTF